MNASKRTRLAYLVSTVLFTLLMLPGAVLDIVQPEMVVDLMAQIGMPLYVIALVGVWKLLGFVALWNRKFPRVTEWAYAGFFFDLSGAMVAHAAGGDIPGVVPAGVFLGLLMVSYRLRGHVKAP